MLSLVEKLQQSAIQFFRERIHCLFSEANEWLMGEMDACRDHRVQQNYAEMMRFLKLYRSQFEQSYFQHIGQDFKQLRVQQAADPHQRQARATRSGSYASLALVGLEEMDQSVALDSMAARCRADWDIPLRKLRARMQSVFPGVPITSDNNPLDPKMICAALGRSVTDIPWEIQHDLIFFKLFQCYVLGDYGDLVANADAMLQGAGVLKNLSERDLLQREQPPTQTPLKSEDVCPPTASPYAAAPCAEPQQPSGLSSDSRDWGTLLRGAMAGLLQPSVFPGAALLGSPNPQAQVLPVPDLVKLLRHVQHATVEKATQGYLPTSNLCHQVNALLQQYDAAGQELVVSDVDSNIIHLVSELFEHVLGNECLPRHMTALLGRLQIPYVRIAIAQPEFITSPDHPARRLINDMTNACLQLEIGQGNAADPVCEQIQTIVTALLENDYDRSSLASLSEDFSAFIEREDQRARLRAQRIAEAEEGRAHAKRVNQEVACALQAIVDNSLLPEPLTNLLDSVWYNYLCFIHHREGPGTLAWNKALLLVEQVLACMLPVESEDESEDRLVTIEALADDIREGARKINCQSSKLDSWLNQLSTILRNKAVYEAPMQSQRAKPELRPIDDASSGTPDRQTDSKLDTVALIDRADRYRAPRIPVASDNDRARSKEELMRLENEFPPLPLENAGMKRARELAVGALLDYQYEGARMRCRLGAHIKSIDKMIFVNHLGAKLFEKSLLAVAHDINAGCVTLLENSRPFDRALESVISSMRAVQTQAV